MQSNTTTTNAADANAYNGKNRNTFLFGFTPQAELWNGRFAMIGFLAYLLWDLKGYSVIRDLFHWSTYSN
ncbi:chlorophyll a/b-binding protein [Altericista sp. CCNU0014]|uniref:chlorophyll a/b-binding protein n=1 Tax=Altericista sp. CCNU0014 TaxID=3082949 RepID=UPI00384BA5CD